MFVWFGTQKVINFIGYELFLSNFSQWILKCLASDEGKDEVMHNPECDAEEEQVEECSRNLLILGKRRIPQSMSEIENFCK